MVIFKRKEIHCCFCNVTLISHVVNINFLLHDLQFFWLLNLCLMYNSVRQYVDLSVMS